MRRAAPFASLPRRGADGVLDMLAGRYPSDAFAGLRARAHLGPRRRPPHGAARRAAGWRSPPAERSPTAASSASTSRASAPRASASSTRRWSTRAAPATSSCSARRAGASRTSPPTGSSSRRRPGTPGKMPFWRGDALGPPGSSWAAPSAPSSASSRPCRRRRATPACARRLRRARRREPAALPRRPARGDRRAARRPHHRRRALPRRGRRLAPLRPLVLRRARARRRGPRRSAPACAISSASTSRSIHGDDGIVIRIPEGDELPSAEAAFIDPEEIEDLVVGELGDSAMFASRFRECAARALLLPSRRPGQRSPLWQQRQRAASLLQVARAVTRRSRSCSRPTASACRTSSTCRRWSSLLRDVRSRARAGRRGRDRAAVAVRQLAAVRYVSAFMYEGDAPLAERRAQALALDRAVLAELMGREELRELLDADALDDARARAAAPGRTRAGARRRRPPRPAARARRPDAGEVAARCRDAAAAPAWLDDARARAARRRRSRVAGDERWIAAEDAARYRDALGVALPLGLPRAFARAGRRSARRPGRALRAHARAVHGRRRRRARLGLGAAVVRTPCARSRRRAASSRASSAPAAAAASGVDAEVLRRLRRRSLAALRREIEPVAQDALARFAAAVARHRRRRAAPRRRSTRCGAPSSSSRACRCRPRRSSARSCRARAARLLAACCSISSAPPASWSGSGAGALGPTTAGSCWRRPTWRRCCCPTGRRRAVAAGAARARRARPRRGAFFRQLADPLGGPARPELVLALWELVWAGASPTTRLRRCAPLPRRGARGAPAARRRAARQPARAPRR